MYSKRVKYQAQVAQLVFCAHHLVQNEGKAVTARTAQIWEVCPVPAWLETRDNFSKEVI